MTNGPPKNIYLGKEKREHRWGVLILLLIGMIVLLGLSHFWRSGLKARTFVVEGNRILSDEEILVLGAPPRSIGLFELDLTVLQTRIGKHPFVKEVIVSRDLPSSIRIRVRERQPVAILAGPEPVFVDGDLVVLPNILSREVFDLPAITGLSGKKSVGTKIESEELRRAVVIIETASRIDQNLYHLISEVGLLDGGDIVLYSSEFGVPILFGQGDEARKLIYLYEFWNQVVSREGASRLESVDLRFEGQVVARWNRQLETSSERKPATL